LRGAQSFVMNNRVWFALGSIAMMLIICGVIQSGIEETPADEQVFESESTDILGNNFEESDTMLGSMSAAKIGETYEDLEIPELELVSSFSHVRAEEVAGKAEMRRMMLQMSKKKHLLDASKKIVTGYRTRIDSERKKIESLVDKLKENTNDMIELGNKTVGDLGEAYECLTPPSFPEVPGLKMAKVQAMKWKYKKLCAPELAQKQGVHERSSKSVEGRQKAAEKQQKSHYRTIELHHKATSKAKKELNQKAAAEVTNKGISEKKVKAAKEALDKAKEKLGKQKSLSAEKDKKDATKRNEVKGKECEQKKVKESAAKMADENTIKKLKERLAKKTKDGKENASKIVGKWHKHLSLEKGEKCAENTVKAHKKVQKQKKAGNALAKKVAKEKSVKMEKSKKSTEKESKEQDAKLSEEKKQKEQFAKGSVREDSHKKETTSKEVDKKHAAFTHWKEKFSKSTDEETNKKSSEYKLKCTEKKSKQHEEIALKKKQELKAKQVQQEKKMKPELKHKEWSHKEIAHKTAHEKEAKGYKESFIKSQEKLKKARLGDKEHQAKCEGKVKAAKAKLVDKVKLLKQHKSEATSKKEAEKKIEAKQKWYTKSEKKEKAAEKHIKLAGLNMTAEFKTKEAETKAADRKKFAKKVSEMQAKAKESTSKNNAECKHKDDLRKRALAHSHELEAKSPFEHVKEINSKLQRMKELWAKKKMRHHETGQKAISHEKQIKFSMSKEVFFKKYSNSTRELNNKKEIFEKQCQMEKEKTTKITLAKVAYSEGKNKKSCISTRIASELNNKKVISYFNETMANLRADCDHHSKLDKKSRADFVTGICKGVQNDVQVSIGKVLSAMKRVRRQSFHFQFNATAQQQASQIDATLALP